MTRCLIGMALVSGAAFLAATGEALTVVRCGCRLEFALDGNGRPTYAIRYGDRDVVRPSTLGFETDAGDLTRGFRIVGSATAARHEVWRPVWGEEEEIADDHDELLVELEQAETGRRLYAMLENGTEGQILSWSLSPGTIGELHALTLRAHCTENIARPNEITG